MSPQTLVNDYLEAGQKFKKAFISTIITLCILPLVVLLVFVTSQTWPLVFFLMGPICCLIIFPEVFRYVIVSGVFLYNAIPFVPLDILGFVSGILFSFGIIISFPWIFCIIAMWKTYKEKKETRSTLEASNIHLPEKDRSKIQLISVIASIVSVYLVFSLTITISAYIDTHPRYSKLDKELLEIYNFYEVTGGYAIATKDKHIGGVVEIPDTFNEELVVAIADDGFNNCKEITKIKLPKSIEVIGESSFEDCVGLLEITLPENLEVIKTSAFEGCTSISEIIIPENVSLGSYAFKDCSGLNVLFISDGVTKENSWTATGIFYGCENVDIVSVPAKWLYKIINDFDIKKLTVTHTAENDFSVCYSDSLETVIFDDGITTIERLQVYGCKNLKEITLPKSIKAIEKSAFNNCPSLISIKYEGTIDEWNNMEIQEGWNTDETITKVYCSDGEIEIVY